MLYTRSFIRTLREAPADALVASHALMLRAGLLRRIGNGLYAYLPPGLRALRKLEAIVRAELERAGALEIKPPVLTPGELWRESGRWQAMGDTMLRARNRLGDDLVVSPTAEELFTAIARAELSSYRDLPLALYQINTKYRDELRPRYGVMRAREFTMMDAYSFDLDEGGLDRSYQAFVGAYRRVFGRCGLGTVEVRADSGDMGGEASEEFMVESSIGDDRLLLCPACGYAANAELGAGVGGGDQSPGGCPRCGAALRERRGIELGHVFKLGEKYSRPMGLRVHDRSGRELVPLMGCYGIGMDRSLAALIEEHHDDAGLVWPISLAPWQVVLVPTRFEGELRERALRLERELEGAGIETLLDDRNERAGVKFKDAELLGIPFRVVLGEKAGGAGLEIGRRGEAGLRSLPDAQAAQTLGALIAEESRNLG